ncbi:MAG: site-specific integrase [Clostridiales bacterium]|nr:site-specific integrase [Clostridiales bacterium]
MLRKFRDYLGIRCRVASWRWVYPEHIEAFRRYERARGVSSYQAAREAKVLAEHLGYGHLWYRGRLLWHLTPGEVRKLDEIRSWIKREYRGYEKHEKARRYRWATDYLLWVWGRDPGEDRSLEVYLGEKSWRGDRRAEAAALLKKVDPRVPAVPPLGRPHPRFIRAGHIVSRFWRFPPLSAKTFFGYVERWREWERYTGKPLGQLAPGLVKEFLGTKELTAQTARVYWSSFRAAEVLMGVMGRAAERPLPASLEELGVRFSSPEEEEEAIDLSDAWQEDEYRAIRERLSEESRAVVDLSWELGLRLVEVFRLRRKDIVAGLAGRRLRVRGKGGRIRFVPVTDRAAAILEEALSRHPGRLLPFLREKDKTHLAQARLQTELSRVRGEATHLHHHGLRHAYAQRWLKDLQEQGVPADVRRFIVSALLGHGRIEVTYIYASRGPLDGPAKNPPDPLTPLTLLAVEEALAVAQRRGKKAMVEKLLRIQRRGAAVIGGTLPT